MGKIPLVIVSAAAGLIFGLLVGTWIGQSGRYHDQAVISKLQSKAAEAASHAQTVQDQQQIELVQVPGVDPKLKTKVAEQVTRAWGIVGHFGRVTTVWLAPKRLGDRNLIAQILHSVSVKYGPKPIVWFFDDARFTPVGVPMTDEQMLHECGQYDPGQADAFGYIKIVDATASPPTTKLVPTNIVPGYAP